MNQPRDPDAIIATWLDDGPVDLPAETRRAIAVGLRTQPRARRMAIPGGSSMSPINRLVAAAAIVVAVGGLSAFVLANRGGGGAGATPAPSVSVGPAATHSPSPAPTIAPSPAASLPSTAGWVAFTSTRYGYTVAHPPTWRAQAATRDWVDADGVDYLGPTTDQFVDPAATYQILVTTFAADLAAGTTADDWMSAYYHDIPDASCRANLAAMGLVTVDGHPGRIWTSTCSDSQAFVLVDGRIHVFSIWRANQEPLLRAFLSTVTFQAPDVSPGPS